MREHSRSSPLQTEVHHLRVCSRLLRSSHGLIQRIAPTLAVAVVSSIFILAMACGSGPRNPRSHPDTEPDTHFDTNADAYSRSLRSSSSSRAGRARPCRIWNRSGSTLRTTRAAQSSSPAWSSEEALGEVVKPDRLSLKFNGTFGGGYAIKSTLGLRGRHHVHDEPADRLLAGDG